MTVFLIGKESKSGEDDCAKGGDAATVWRKGTERALKKGLRAEAAATVAGEDYDCGMLLRAPLHGMHCVRV